MAAAHMPSSITALTVATTDSMLILLCKIQISAPQGQQQGQISRFVRR